MEMALLSVFTLSLAAIIVVATGVFSSQQNMARAPMF